MTSDADANYVGCYNSVEKEDPMDDDTKEFAESLEEAVNNGEAQMDVSFKFRGLTILVEDCGTTIDLKKFESTSWDLANAVYGLGERKKEQ